MEVRFCISSLEAVWSGVLTGCGQEGDPEESLHTLKGESALDFAGARPQAVTGVIGDRGHRHFQPSVHPYLHVSADDVGQFAESIAHIVVHGMGRICAEQSACETASLPVTE